MKGSKWLLVGGIVVGVGGAVYLAESIHKNSEAYKKIELAKNCISTGKYDFAKYVLQEVKDDAKIFRICEETVKQVDSLLYQVDSLSATEKVIEVKEILKRLENYRSDSLPFWEASGKAEEKLDEAVNEFFGKYNQELSGLLKEVHQKEAEMFLYWAEKEFEKNNIRHAIDCIGHALDDIYKLLIVFECQGDNDKTFKNLRERYENLARKVFLTQIKNYLEKAEMAVKEGDIRNAWNYYSMAKGQARLASTEYNVDISFKPSEFIKEFKNKVMKEISGLEFDSLSVEEVWKLYSNIEEVIQHE